MNWTYCKDREPTETRRFYLAAICNLDTGETWQRVGYFDHQGKWGLRHVLRTYAWMELPDLPPLPEEEKGL